MKTKTILRSAAAAILTFVAMTAAGQAQIATDTTTGLVAMTSIRETEGREMETRAQRIERVVEAVADVKGFEAEAAVRSAIELRLTEETDDVKVLRAVMTKGEWTVKTNELGIPKSEYRRGVVLYERPSDGAVIQQQIVVERPYFAPTENAVDYSVRLGTPTIR